MFALNDTQVNLHDIRSINKSKVNFAQTSTYHKSGIPYIQNMLNDHLNRGRPKPG